MFYNRQYEYFFKININNNNSLILLDPYDTVGLLISLLNLEYPSGGVKGPRMEAMFEKVRSPASYVLFIYLSRVSQLNIIRKQKK